MARLSWLANFFTAPAQVPAQLPVPALQAMPVPPAGDVATSEAEDEQFSLTNGANAVLTAALRKARVDRYGSKEDVSMPVQAVRLTSYGFGGESPGARLQLDFGNTPIGDFAPESLTAAVHKVLGVIPALKDKLRFEQKKPNANSAAGVWEQLKAMIEAQPGLFSADEVSLLEKYFKSQETDGLMAFSGNRDHIEVEPVHGRVRATFQTEAANGEEGSSALSADQQIVDYVARHKEAILARFKEKVATLHILSEEELAQIDMDVSKKSENGGPDKATVEFGIRAQDSMSGLQPAKLAEIDAKKLDDFFTQALLEAQKELPPILSRIADGQLMATILRARFQDNPELEKLLENDIFHSWAEQSKIRAEKNSPEHPLVGNVTVNEFYSSVVDTNGCSIEFTLPKGMDIAALRADIYHNRNQIQLGMEQERVLSPAG